MPHSRILSLWLLFCAFMVLAMTGIGAVTRLTESGLSITEWNVVSGTLPPLSDASWHAEFSKYQATPEFSAKHHWMQLSDFKQIYFWEWFHRFWGRMIGVVFALPLLFFWIKGWIPKEDRMKYSALLVLGGSQGALGWFMVKSGLVDRPSVSHFRLAAHLSLALVIYSALLWMAWRVKQNYLPVLSHQHFKRGVVCVGAVFLTIIFGAFVAGLDAGMIYNSFPLMGGQFFPPELGRAPFLLDPASIQFAHRWLAIATGCLVLYHAYRIESEAPALSRLMAVWVLFQIGLGITTLLSVVWIPVAVLHQLSAAILLAIVLYSVYLGRLRS